MIKNTAHNLNEVKALVREAFQNGNELEFHKTQWMSHSGTFICTSHVRDVEFELVVEDVDTLGGFRSVICEVY